MTSPVNTSVKFFSSDMSGAPQGFSGTVGSALPIIQACLVDGFDTVTLSSLVVSSGVATATFPTAHSARAEAVVLIAGVADKTGLNGEQKIVTRVGNTVTFATAETSGTASGTITMKMAPAGWTREFTGTNLAVYRAPDIDGTRFYLRLADTAAQDLRVVGYESMSGISTGTNPFPTNAQQSGGLYWPKSDTADATNNPWMLFADGKRLYLCVSTYYALGGAIYDGCYMFGFGDFSSYKSTADAYNAFVSGSIVTVSWADHLGLMTGGATSALSLVRSNTGAVGAVNADRQSSVVGQGAGVSGQVSLWGAFPGVTDSLILGFPVIGTPINSVGPRGRLAGLWHSPQTFSVGAFNRNDLVVGAGETAGRKLLAVPVGANPSSISNGASALFVDVTGPW